MSSITKHFNASVGRTNLLVGLFLIFSQLSIAQTGYVATEDSALYYMDFESEAYKLMMKFPFKIREITSDHHGHLYATTSIARRASLIKIDPMDSSYTHLFSHPGGAFTFINDSMMYVGTNENLILYNLNTSASSIIPGHENRDYSDLSYDQKSGRLYVHNIRHEEDGHATWSIDELLVFDEDLQLIHQTDFEHPVDPPWEIELDQSGDLYVRRWKTIYKVNIDDGNSDGMVVSFEEYFPWYYFDIAFIEHSESSDELFTPKDQLQLGSIPSNKAIERKFIVENISNQPWKFNGVEVHSEHISLSTNHALGSEITDFLEVNISMKKPTNGSYTDSISINWNDTSTFDMNFEFNAINYYQAEEGEAFLSLLSGEILKLDDSYFYQGATPTNLFSISQITMDEEGYLYLTHYGKFYLLDWNTGTLWREPFPRNTNIRKVFFGETNTYYWEDPYCGSPWKIYNQDFETLYTFHGDETPIICVTSAVLKKGTEEFYFLASAGERLYRLDFSAENPTLELLLEYSSLSNLHFDEEGNLRAMGVPENQSKIYQIAEDFSSVELIRESSFLDNLEITSLAASSLSGLVLSVTPNQSGEASDVVIYPNPVQDKLNIEDSFHQISKASLFTQSGQLIDEILPPFRYQMPPELKSGVYLLEVNYTNGSSKTFKIIRSNR